MNDAAQLGPLPTWDLDDLYPGIDSRELERDLTDAAREATAFSHSHKGKLAGLDGAALGAAVAEYERQEERLGRAMSYASLVYSGAITDPEVGRFYQTVQERVNAAATELLFFELELRRIEDADLNAKMKAPALAKYAPWLREMRAWRPHQLSDEVEKLLLEKSVAGRSAWVRLFDETVADARFEFRGRQLTETEILDHLSDPDRDKRRDAAKGLGAGLAKHIRTITLVTNTLAKDKQIEDRWRGFARPISVRNLANCVEDEVVEALLQAAQDAYPRLSHRYYALKARWLGLDRLEYWDRNAPPPDEDERIIRWDDARDTVLGAYGRFSPRLAELGKRFFDRPWIDAPPRAGKASGAFAHPTVPSAHPYLLLNYQGRTRDVMTLAHELGHGVHQVLSAGQGHLMAGTPLTLAETASVFGEMLTFQSMLSRTTDPKARRGMLAGKIEDMINTVIRQTAFCRFEREIHDARSKAELTADEIGAIWLQVQSDSLGPAFHFDEEYRHYWAYILHFIHSPFYVYAYAFGDCLVNALYSVYRDAEAGFADKYLEMLSAGGTLRHKELLAPFGLDAGDPAFWSKGLGVIESLIDELEAKSLKDQGLGGLEVLSRKPDRRTHPSPLLFIHGAFGGAWCWEEHFLPWFAARGFAAYALSLRGHGGSDGTEDLQSWSIADYVDDLAATVAAMPETPVLIGHSMGAFVIQKYLETHTAPAAALIAPVPPAGLVGPSASMALWEPGLLWEIGNAQSLGGRWASAATLRRALLSDDVPEEEAARFLARMTGESMAAVMDMSGRDLVDTSRVGPLPLLIIGGEKDKLIPPAYVRSAARSYGIRALILPGLAHGMMLGPGREAVAACIHDWLIGLAL